MPQRARSAAHKSGMGTVPTFAIISGAIGLGGFWLLARNLQAEPVLLWMAAWGVTAFGFYGWDKSQAQRGGWRVPEVVLHGLAIVGGVIGAWAGMFLFRHKTQHAEFKLVLIFATILWGAIVLAMLQ